MRSYVVTFGLVGLLSATGLAQQRTLAPLPQLPPPPGPGGAPPAPSTAPAPSNPRLPAPNQPNVRIDLLISEDGGAAPARKSAMVLVQAGGTASLRSAVPFQGRGAPFPAINIDVRLGPYAASDAGKISGRITVDYQPAAPSEGATAMPAGVRAQVDSQFVDGKKIVLWQASDPVSDRKTTIEVTATIVK